MSNLNYHIYIPQGRIVEAGLANKTDMVDWAIIHYIERWFESSKALRIKVGRDNMVWINRQHLLNCMPLLGINTVNKLTERFKKLEDLGLIKRNILKRRVYMCFTQKCKDIISTPSKETATTVSKDSNLAQIAPPKGSNLTKIAPPKGRRSRSKILIPEVKILPQTPKAEETDKETSRSKSKSEAIRISEAPDLTVSEESGTTAPSIRVSKEAGFGTLTEGYWWVKDTQWIKCNSSKMDKNLIDQRMRDGSLIYVHDPEEYIRRERSNAAYVESLTSIPPVDKDDIRLMERAFSNARN